MEDRILVVEDDTQVREAVSLVLQGAGYEVDCVADGDAAVERIRASDPDLIVLDLGLPGRDGFEVCREARRASSVPIVMLTARTDAADVVRGLELGADDYVTKPFDPGELAARVRAVLRRSGDAATGSGPAPVDVRDLHVDEQAFRAFKAADELALTTIEMRLLLELTRHPGTALTREVLLDRVWGYGYLGDSRLVDMAIKRLRDKLGDAPDDVPYISTVRGVGYRFETGEPDGNPSVTEP